MGVKKNNMYLNIVLVVFAFPLVHRCRLFNRLLRLEGFSVCKKTTTWKPSVRSTSKMFRGEAFASWNNVGVRQAILPNLSFSPQSAMLAVLVAFDRRAAESACRPLAALRNGSHLPDVTPSASIVTWLPGAGVTAGNVTPVQRPRRLFI